MVGREYELEKKVQGRPNVTDEEECEKKLLKNITSLQRQSSVPPINSGSPGHPANSNRGRGGGTENIRALIRPAFYLTGQKKDQSCYIRRPRGNLRPLLAVGRFP